MRVAVAVLTLMLVTACSDGGASSDGGGGGAGAGSCAAPQAIVSDATVQPGQRVTVSIEGLFDDCADTNGAPTPRPVSGAEVWFHQADHNELVGVADASGPDAAATVEVVVPAEAVAGPADFTIGVSEPAVLTVVLP